MVEPGRKFVKGSSKYRYGFNGKENDNETTGTSTYDYGFRIYNPALGRFLSVDPLTYSYPYYSPYQFAGNMPIAAIDLDGLEQYVVIYFKDQKGSPYKMEIRTIKANKILVDQNVQAIKKGSNETDGNKIAYGNVLVFELYNEDTKKESMKVIDSRNIKNSELTSTEIRVLNSSKSLEHENDTRFVYPSEDKSKYQSQDFENAEFFIATKLFTAKVKPIDKVINDIPSVMVSNGSDNGDVLIAMGAFYDKLKEALSPIKKNDVVEQVKISINWVTQPSSTANGGGMFPYINGAKAKIEKQIQTIAQKISGVSINKIKVNINLSEGSSDSKTNVNVK